MEDDADLREQLFHNTVRENIVSNFLNSFPVWNQIIDNFVLFFKLPSHLPHLVYGTLTSINCWEIDVSYLFYYVLKIKESNDGPKTKNDKSSKYKRFQVSKFLFSAEIAVEMWIFLIDNFQVGDFAAPGARYFCFTATNLISNWIPQVIIEFLL